MSFLYSFRSILSPAVRFAVKRALPIQEFIEVVKELYVEETCAQMGKDLSPNVTQIAIASGMHRRDVNRILNRESSLAKSEPTNLLMKILGTWEQKRTYHDKNGNPKRLSYRGMRSEFYRLVTSLSTDVSPKAVRLELLRLGVVREHEGTLELLGNPELLLVGDTEGFAQLASDVKTLGDATFINLYQRSDPPHLHARTEYDNIFEESLPVIKKWLVELGTEIHQRTRAFLSAHDKDLSPDPARKAGAKVTLCTFSLTEGRVSVEEKHR